MTKILVIEDDPATLMGLVDNLQYENYKVISAKDGGDGLCLAHGSKPDLIILDIMLPGVNGYEICRRLKQEGVDIPIIMLTAKGDEVDRVLGLDLGADDYVVKPFSLPELMARIRAVLRRGSTKKEELKKFSFGAVRLDFKRFEATKGGEAIHLSAREFAIMKLLIQNAGQVVPRDRMLDEVWGYDVYPTTRTVDNHIAQLRRKLEDDPSNPKHILTVRSAGYKFVP